MLSESRELAMTGLDVSVLVRKAQAVVNNPKSWSDRSFFLVGAKSAA